MELKCIQSRGLLKWFIVRRQLKSKPSAKKFKKRGRTERKCTGLAFTTSATVKATLGKFTLLDTVVLDRYSMNQYCKQKGKQIEKTKRSVCTIRKANQKGMRENSQRLECGHGEVSIASRLAVTN
tara:strand:- start:272 stop:646 length:375 start_codon:yes stop_codon:yes gene_type:complete